jgi:hypothetical protein
MRCNAASALDLLSTKSHYQVDSNAPEVKIHLQKQRFIKHLLARKSENALSNDDTANMNVQLTVKSEVK